MTNDGPPDVANQPVLLLPATRRDADATSKLLATAGIGCAVLSDMVSLAAAVTPSAGVVVVAEEFLAVPANAFATALSSQPVWSDLPVIVLSRAGVESPRLTAALPWLGNATVLERPVRMSTLLTVVQSALRARQRQYEVRTHLAELAQSERYRRDLLDAEREARAEAERANRMKDEFLATLSHELRTPLNAILGWSQLMLAKRKSLLADTVEGLEVIERNARSQTQIIQDLLDMSRIIAGKVLLEVRPTDLAFVLRSAIETVQPAAKAKGVQIQTEFDGGDSRMLADPDRLQQVFWNLLSNAVKFTPAGGRISVQLALGGGQVRVRISDSGKGISEAFLPYMFDRFRQADSTTTRQHGGLGLGLSIVRQLVELHGGTVSAASEGKGRGATFTVVLPRVADYTPPPEIETSDSDVKSTSGVPTGSLDGLHVLFVDDEADARTFLSRLLEHSGARVTSVATVQEAMAALAETPPDLLLSDISMPGEDGYDLIRKIRSQPTESGGAIPAVALTAYARPRDTRQILAAGFQAHVTKPVNLAKLTSVLSALNIKRLSRMVSE